MACILEDLNIYKVFSDFTHNTVIIITATIICCLFHTGKETVILIKGYKTRYIFLRFWKCPKWYPWPLIYYRQIKPGSIQTDLLQVFPSMMTHKESFKIMLWMNKVYVKEVEENMRDPDK